MEVFGWGTALGSTDLLDFNGVAEVEHEGWGQHFHHEGVADEC